MSQLFVFLVLLTSLMIVGCTETDDDISTVTIETVPANSLRILPENMPAASVSNILQWHLDYSFAEFQVRIPTEGNSIIAPFDWQQMLAALALGAEDTTLDKFSIASKLDFNSVSTFEDLSVWEQSIASNTAIERSSYLWGQGDYLFSVDYLKQQAEWFGALITASDFRLDSYQSVLDIEQVVSDSLFIGSRTRVVLSQISNIEGYWSSSLSAEAVQARFAYGDKQILVSMTRLDGAFNRYRGSNFGAAQIPLADSNLSAMIITPDRGQFESVKNGLNKELWNLITTNLSSTEGSVYIPNFVLNRTLTTADLPALDIAASEDEANFSAVNNVGFLYLKNTSQNISLHVDVNGFSSGVSSTAVLSATDDEPFFVFDEGLGDVTNSYFTVTETVILFRKACYNRPEQSEFIFALYDNSSKTILNIGQIRELSGESVAPDWYVGLEDNCGELPPVDVYKYKGSVQCDFNSGTDYLTMNKNLINAGIYVYEARESTDGLAYTTVCGAADGVINVFKIFGDQLSEAQALGFKLLSELPM